MASRWVGKTLPEVRRGDAAPNDRHLQTLRTELVTLIGDDNVRRMEWRRMADDAGGPRWVAAFEITETGWDILTTGFPGPQGFEPLASS